RAPAPAPAARAGGRGVGPEWGARTPRSCRCRSGPPRPRPRPPGPGGWLGSGPAWASGNQRHARRGPAPAADRAKRTASWLQGGENEGGPPNMHDNTLSAQAPPGDGRKPFTSPPILVPVWRWRLVIDRSWLSTWTRRAGRSRRRRARTNRARG